MKRIIIPFDAREVKLTSPYGSRTLNGKANFHAGYDLVGIGSRNVTAAVGGTVVVSRIITDKSNRTWEWGNYVCIRGDDGIITTATSPPARSPRVRASMPGTSSA